ncbi:uncharacterized protein LOC134533509 [Bacillus rossius redtenbacheri]|uniref:uncharacterized protein LOC134533509 n=1 Tax=Bacillus rossius redtenbacheri TaxID=93214 RepID=UPI002FDDA655
MILGVSRCLRVAHLVCCGAIIVLASVMVPLCVLLWDTFSVLSELLYSQVALLPAATGVVSLALFVFSLVGIWAAAAGSVAAFRLYTSSLLVVLLGKLLWLTMSASIQLDFIAALELAFDWYMERYQFQPSVMDRLQWRLACCGKDSPADWFNLTGYIPASCCHKITDAHQFARCMVPEQLYMVPPVGCLRVIKEMPREYYSILQVMFHASSVILVVSLCVSYYMGKACSRYEKESFLLKKNVIEGHSAYESEDNSAYTLLKINFFPSKNVEKRDLKRPLLRTETKKQSVKSIK